MTFYDLFNGDADGLCALQQLRLAEPVTAHLISGPKRDLNLLSRIQDQVVTGDQVTMLDLALDPNRPALMRVLARGAMVRYFDHHVCGKIPAHPGLTTFIETLPDQGTSLLVDAYLGGRFRAWAVVGTFGDNFYMRARNIAAPLDLDTVDLARLRDLGIYLNYNGYGSTLADLHIPPETLAVRLRPYVDPLAFIAEDGAFTQLATGYREDMAQAAQLIPEWSDATHALYVLPTLPWARRVSGVFANQLAQNHPDRAHALLTQLPAGGFLVSVRAPITRPQGADVLCRQFPSGGGRPAAAGINQLADDAYSKFLEQFIKEF